MFTVITNSNQVVFQTKDLAKAMMECRLHAVNHAGAEVEAYESPFVEDRICCSSPFTCLYKWYYGNKSVYVKGEATEEAHAAALRSMRQELQATFYKAKSIQESKKNQHLASLKQAWARFNRADQLRAFTKSRLDAANRRRHALSISGLDATQAWAECQQAKRDHERIMRLWGAAYRTRQYFIRLSQGWTNEDIRSTTWALH